MGGSNLSVGLTLSVRISNFDSPLYEVDICASGIFVEGPGPPVAVVVLI